MMHWLMMRYWAWWNNHSIHLGNDHDSELEINFLKGFLENVVDNKALFQPFGVCVCV